jgi:hypothetical protein
MTRAPDDPGVGPSASDMAIVAAALALVVMVAAVAVWVFAS